jgi:glycosyltransferase involved in cell wall biosynthesis
MKILALEPYYGGSHKEFLDGFSMASRHNWTLLTLEAFKWKWRMRHSAVTFAEQLDSRLNQGENWDLIFCSDMLNLAEFKGLAQKPIRDLPAVIYFHENQLTYPVRFESERDFQFAMTNMTSCLAAGSVWFNSEFHRSSFLNALKEFLKKMPDYQPLNAVEQIQNKSSVYPPPVTEIKKCEKRKKGPLHLLWAARWEHDKGPEDLFEALKILKSRGVEFRVSVIGQQFRDIPEVFQWAKAYFAENIDLWGYQQTRAQYEHALKQADVFVSTAKHEFFGISAVEAAFAGAYPVLPNRLAYPEIFGLGTEKGAEEFFYDGTVIELVEKLSNLSEKVGQGSLWNRDNRKVIHLLERLKWNNMITVLDDAIENIIDS